MDKKAEHLFNAFETLRKHANERELPAQLISIFLYIATHDDVRQGDLVEAVGLSPSSVSRCIHWLGPRNTLKRRSGLRWVDIYPDPLNHKRKRVRLTHLGKRILTEITSPR